MSRRKDPKEQKIQRALDKIDNREQVISQCMNFLT